MSNGFFALKNDHLVVVQNLVMGKVAKTGV